MGSAQKSRRPGFPPFGLGAPLKVTEEKWLDDNHHRVSPVARPRFRRFFDPRLGGVTGAALSFRVDTNFPLPVILGLGSWIGGGIVIVRLHKAAHDMTRKLQRDPFQVSRLGLRLSEGTLLTPSQIYAIRRRTTQSGDRVVVSGVGMVAGMSQMAAESSQRLARASHTAEVEHGGRSTVLAGGLTQTKAHAVAAEITRRLPCFGT